MSKLKTEQPRRYFKLSRAQIAELMSICFEAAQMHDNFLMHDDWGEGGHSDLKRKTISTQKRYLKHGRKLLELLNE